MGTTLGPAVSGEPYSPFRNLTAPATKFKLVDVTEDGTPWQPPDWTVEQTPLPLSNNVARNYDDAV